MTSRFIWGGCDVVELARRFGTPLYVMDEEELHRRCHVLTSAVESRRARLCYAGKAFLPLAMIQLIAQEGLGLDVVSSGELYLAQQAGMDMSRVMLHGNAKTKETLLMALRCGVGHIVVDGHDELEGLESLAAEGGFCPSILFRVSPGIETSTHRFIQTAQRDCKFGVPLEVLPEAVRRAVASPHLNLTGLHIHLGSQIRDVESYLRSVEVMTELLSNLRDATGWMASELNLGGGFGVAEGREKLEAPAPQFISQIIDALEARFTQARLVRPELIFEPGRWIAAPAGVTLYEVQACKDIPGVRRYAALDGGMTDNPRPALYGAHYDALLASDMSRQGSQVTALAGPCCESGDVLTLDAELPPLKRGDIIAVRGTGAYNYSMFNGYNCTPRPAVVFASHGEARLVVQRQGCEDLMKGQYGLAGKDC